MEKNEKCIAWLKSILKDGDMHLCEIIRDAAKAEGYTRGNLKAARNALGVKTYHMFDEGEATENWFWYLEEEQ